MNQPEELPPATSSAGARETHRRVVRTLIGHRQVAVGLQCLASLLRLSFEPFSLQLHDDGTLTQQDCEALTTKLPGTAIISRAESDEKVMPTLAHYSKCSNYRRSNPLGLKLIDMPLFEPQDLAYCDSDVLFLKPYTQLFHWPDRDTSAVFMQDSQDAYSLRPWHIYPVGKIRVPRRVNTGIILFRTARYDLDFVEWFLGRRQLEEVFAKRRHWIEQTCWASLGWRAGCYVWDPRQLIIASPKMTGLSPETVAIHFVASYRGKLAEFQETPPVADQQTPVTLAARPARLSSPRRMLLQDVRSRF